MDMHDNCEFIDSGADVCVMREDILHNIAKDNYVELHNDKDRVGKPGKKTTMNVIKHAYSSAFKYSRHFSACRLSCCTVFTDRNYSRH